MEPLRTERRAYWISRAPCRCEEGGRGSSIWVAFVPIITRMAASEESHWRKLGDLLVAENVLVQADLDFALAVQRQTGGLLGEILVTRGFVSNAAMVQALARQHGMRVNMAAEVRERRLRVPRAPTRVGPIPWKPLGRLLVDLGLLTEDGLKRALIDQRRTGRLLGVVLVNLRLVAAEDVVIAAAQQHGL